MSSIELTLRSVTPVLPLINQKLMCMWRRRFKIWEKATAHTSQHTLKTIVGVSSACPLLPSWRLQRMRTPMKSRHMSARGPLFSQSASPLCMYSARRTISVRDGGQKMQSMRHSLRQIEKFQRRWRWR